MEERKHWLLSRKFWLAVVTAVTMILADNVGIDLDPEVVVAIILPVVAYILGESLVDAKAVKKNGESSALTAVVVILVKACIASRSRHGITVAYAVGEPLEKTRRGEKPRFFCFMPGASGPVFLFL